METWSWYEVWGGWISIINLIILTLNLTARGWIWCLCRVFICMWSCVSKQGWLLLLCGEKTQMCERPGQLRHYWPLWMRRSERSGGCHLSASCCSVRRVTFDDKRAQALPRVIDNLITRSIKTLAETAFAQILPWYDIWENSIYLQYFCNPETNCNWTVKGFITGCSLWVFVNGFKLGDVWNSCLCI